MSTLTTLLLFLFVVVVVASGRVEDRCSVACYLWVKFKARSPFVPEKLEQKWLIQFEYFDPNDV